MHEETKGRTEAVNPQDRAEEVPAKSEGTRNRFPRKTRYPGIEETRPGTYRIRLRVTDPRKGKMLEIDRRKECTEKEAVLLQARWREEIARGDGRAEGARVRLGDFARLWLSGKLRVVLPPTVDRYTDALEDQILPELGDLYADAVTHDDIVRWRDGKKDEEYASATVNGWLRVLKTVMADATAQLRLPANPAARVAALPEDDTRVTADEPNSLDEEEVSKFLAVARVRWPEHFAMILTLLVTGARMSQVCALKWEDIDEAAARIRFQRRRYRDQVYAGIKGANPAARRAVHDVPLVSELAAVLRQHRQELVLAQHRGLGEGWVFPGRNGQPHSNSILQKPFADILKHAEIRKRFTPHGLRRTATDLLRRAAGSSVAKSVVGHATEAMHEHYSNVALSEKSAAVSKALRLVLPKSGGGSGGGSDA